LRPVLKEVNPIDGYIYVMSNDAFAREMVKVGKSSRHPNLGRKSELFTTGVPGEFDLEYWAKVPDCSRAETKLHNKLAHYRYSSRREFFVVALGELIHSIKETLGKAISEEGFSDKSEKAFMQIASEGVIKKYWDNGEVREMTEFSHYPDDFVVTEYSKAGQIKVVMRYVGGKLNGERCKWNGKGDLIQKGYMLMGQRQGEWYWKRGKRFFDKGMPVLMWESFSATGELVQKFQGKPKEGIEAYKKRNLEAINFDFS